MSWNDQELERFETELRRLRPSLPPPDFLQRLKSETAALVAERRAEAKAAAPATQPEKTAVHAAVGASQPEAWSAWRSLALRWLVPATAVLVVGAVIWRGSPPAERSKGSQQSASAPVKADDVQINQQLVSTFDAVAPLPSGEPVRFRCREWMDEVVLRDSRRGVEVTRRVPRVEVVPVRFETY
jgi:hypothetical protein